MAQWGVSLIGIANLILMMEQMEMALDQVESDVWRITIGGGPDGVEYHLFVEFGTTMNRAQPYIRPAMRAGVREWPRIAAQAAAQESDPEDVYAKAIEHLARFVHAKMRAEVPVDTGDLRNSIRLEKLKDDRREKPETIENLL